MPKVESWEERIKKIITDGFNYWLGNRKNTIDNNQLIEYCLPLLSEQIHQAQVEILRDVLPKEKEANMGIRMEINFGNTTVGDVDKMITNGENNGFNECRSEILSKAKESGISEEEITK